MKKGDRYIIEIEEVLDGEKFDIGRIKGFASMVVTDEAIGKLPSFKFAEESAYKRGLYVGQRKINEKSYNAGVRQGVDHVYNACAWYIDNFGAFEVKNDSTISDVVKKYEDHNRRCCADYSNEDFHEYLIENMNPTELERFWDMYKNT